MVKGLWDALQEKADNQSAENIKECDEKIAQLQQQLSQHRQFQSETTAKIHTLEEQNHRQSDEINTLKQALNAEQHEKIKITERTTNLESNKGQAQAEIERLHQLLKHVQDNLEHYQTATQQLRQEQALQIEKQRSEYEQKISQLQNQIELIFTEKTNYQVQCVQLNKTQEQLENDHKALVLQYNKMQQQHSILKATDEKMQKDYEKLTATHQQQSQSLEGKHHAVIELQIKLKTGDEKIIMLQSELSKANDKVNALRHDHQFMAQEKANLEGQLKQFQSVLFKKNAVVLSD